MNDIKENPLHISWHDSAWIPILNPSNVLDYFSEKSNPFYDRTCNNEIIKMQRLEPQRLQIMTGLEYILLHVQEPILYVIRKQERYSPTQVKPIADYYILAGYVYQAPDLNSVISSRMSASIHHFLSAFDDVNSYMRYHSTKGYSWDFGKDSVKDTEKQGDKLKEKIKEETSSAFQRARVDVLLQELVKKFPPKVPAGQPAIPTSDSKPIITNGALEDQKPTVEPRSETETEVTQEKPESGANSNTNAMPGRQSTAPPEKRQRLT